MGELEVQEASAKYKVVDAFEGLIYVCSQDYEVEFMNRNFIQRTGYDAVGHKCYKALHDLDSVCSWCVNEKVFNGETVRWEVKSTKDDRWYCITNTPIYHKDGSLSKMAMIRDITELKEAQEELRKSRDKLELRVQERTLALKDSYDKLRIEVDERKRSEELLLEGRDLALKLSATSDLHEALNFCLDAALNMGNMDAGGIYLVDETTGALHLEVHKNLSEVFLSQVMDYGPETPNALLVSRGQPLYTNGKEIGLLPKLDNVETVRGLAILPIISVPRIIACLNVASRTSDVIVESSRIALETVAAQVAGAIDRIAKEKKRAELEEQLRQSHKMEAIGTLAGGIAHDFNNMLAIIMGNAELALDDVDKPESRQSLEAILGASKRSRDLVRQILTFSRKSDSPKRRILNLTPLLEESIKMLQGMIPSSVKIHLDINTDEDAILADPTQIQQILMNMAANAMYAMREEGGLLTISLSDRKFNLRDPIPGKLKPGQYVKLVISDTGAGIPYDIRTRIFEPFFTTKKVGVGTGMGLAVVWGIVTNHGGEITVDSEVGKGTTFNVFFPSKEKKPEEQSKEHVVLKTGKEKILLVDDEPSVLDVAAKMLTSLGYEVTTALSGPEGLQLFKQKEFDLVITDHVMPEMTGMRLAERIVQERPGMPLILFTGYSETVSRKITKRAGITQFVMKPVVKRELEMAVRKALDSRNTC